MFLAFFVRLVGAKWAKLVMFATIALAVIALIAIGLKVVSVVLDNAQEAGEEIGESRAVVAGQNTTLKQVEKANEAAASIRNDTDLSRYCECVQSASKATAGHCVRYVEDKSLLADPANLAKRCARGGG